MLQDLEISTVDWAVTLRKRVKEMERQILWYKKEVSEYENEATGYEVRLGLLEKEGECRT